MMSKYIKIDDLRLHLQNLVLDGERLDPKTTRLIIMTLRELPIHEFDAESATTTDCISRQQAVDAIECVDWYHVNSKGELVHGSTSDEESWYKAEDIYEAIESLPAVAPDFKSFCGVPIKEAIEVLEQHKGRAEVRGLDDCISRSWMVNALQEVNGESDMPSFWHEGMNDAIEEVKNAPSVTPTERTGEWIENATEGQDIDPPYICSTCGYAESRRTPFCEQCKAKMKGGTENDR